jgi:hypothetical protein
MAQLCSKMHALPQQPSQGHESVAQSLRCTLQRTLCFQRILKKHVRLSAQSPLPRLSGTCYSSHSCLRLLPSSHAEHETMPRKHNEEKGGLTTSPPRPLTNSTAEGVKNRLTLRLLYMFYRAKLTNPDRLIDLYSSQGNHAM